MARPAGFFGFDSLMELIAFAIAIAVAYQALKGYRLSKQRYFLYLNVSFGLLGAGLFIDAVANLVVILSRFHRGFVFLSAVGYTLNFVAQLLAYGILVFTYVQQSRMAGGEIAFAALPLALFEYNSFTELILVMLVAYIMLHTAFNYSMSRSSSALLVFGAFASLTVAHVLFLLYTLFPILFVFAHIAQLFGFLMLLAMLLKVNHAR